MIIRFERVYLGLVVCFSLRNALKCEDKFVVVFSLHEFFAKDYKMKEETKFITTNKNIACSFRRRKKATAANTTAEKLL